ncbi:MAG: sulfotransferase domain-containing protein [Promethearchaeota archaeon]
MKKIIYLAGYGRSGSTILERILGANKNIIALGELKDFLYLLDSFEERCSCGEKLNFCSFWNPICNDFRSMNLLNLKKNQLNFESIFGFCHLFLKNKKSNREEYKKFLENLFSRIISQSNNEIKYVTDSSKTARESFFRPLLLKEINNIEVKMIHIVKDGRACLYSNLTGSNRLMEKGIDARVPWAGLRTVISWPLANLAAHLFQLISDKGDYFRLRYEDFLKEPEKYLKELGNFLDIDFSPQIKMINREEIIPLSHQIAGNRIRSQVNLRLNGKNKEVWKKKLSWQYRLLFWLFDWPFTLIYKYH